MQSTFSKCRTGTVAAFVLWGASAATAHADLVLFEHGVNVDGVTGTAFDGCGIDCGLDASGFDFATGLGTIRISLSGVGDHNVALYLDHEIHEAENTYFNETGSATGTPDSRAAGDDGDLSWEIDEPGWGWPQDASFEEQTYFGDIWFNLEDTAPGVDWFDNSLFYDWFTDSSVAGPNDVSMALAWQFALLADEIATITFTVQDVLPDAGFFLTQSDPGEENAGVAPLSIYFHAALDIRSASVPEPGTLALLGVGVLGLAMSRRRRAG